MTASVTGYAIIQGFVSTLDTLLPPAWTSDAPHMVGLWTQRACQVYSFHRFLLVLTVSLSVVMTVIALIVNSLYSYKMRQTNLCSSLFLLYGSILNRSS